MRDGSIRYITIGQGTKRQTYRFAPADLADFIEKQAQQEAAPCPSTKTRARRTTSTNFNSKVIAIADRLRSGASAKRKP
ncbi:hypothetical protein [Methyloceanibacter caenitepidi]|uniref:hypothetical protein n=1 Tax=Methyloceanibacter caenitepidi TaxID=1384459 RepID=UPI003CC7AFD3